MIEYDYRIERDEGDRTRVFKPKGIPKELPNLVSIKGPNSIGKSTLLHILALSMHGLTKDNMNPALRNRMLALLDPNHQKLEFKVKVGNNDETLQIESRKDDPGKQEIIVREIKDGKKKILSPETFLSKYNLIYDIPDNPTERLNQLTLEIRDLQLTYGNRIGAFTNHLVNVTRDIRNARDPERISELKQQLKDSRKETEELEAEMSFKQNHLALLEKFYHCRSYTDYLEEYRNISEEHDDVAKEARKKARKIKKISKDHESVRFSVKVDIGWMRERFHRVSSLLKVLLPKKEQDLLGVWEKIDLNQALLESKFSGNLKRLTVTFKVILVNIIDEEKKKKSLDQAKMYEDLIEFLEHYRTSEIVIPGVDKTVGDFIEVLKSSNQKNEELLNLSKNIDEALVLLDEMNQKRESLEKNLLPKLEKLSDYEKDDSDGLFYDEVEERIEELEEGIKDVEDRVEFHRMGCAKLDISEDKLNYVLMQLNATQELKPYQAYTEEQLAEKITEMKEDTFRNRESLKSMDRYIGLTENEIESLESKKPHKYQKHLDKLEDLLPKCQYLTQKLQKEYHGYIQSIIDKKAPRGKTASEEQKKYFEEVSKYLGKRVGFIQHVEDEYEVKIIDLIKGVIETEEGKIIRLTDMGTGQSQSAYLRGKLSTTDNRKILALFDEVAMMDQTSLNTLFVKMRELYEEGRMIMGVVIQKANEVKVEPLMR